MLFVTYHYAIFLAVALAIYWSTPWNRVRLGLMAVAGIAFYATWNVSLAALVVGGSLVNFALALVIDSASETRKRTLLTLGIVFNLAVLGVFKYANFFVDSFRELLILCGASPPALALEILVPVGISLYTFEAISYLVDVRFGRTPATRNPVKLLIFILFFPHLIAGPIVRAKDFLPQLESSRRWRDRRFGLGLLMIFAGVFKKLAIADPMGQLIDPVLANPSHYDGLALIFAAIGFTIQIYCDFSGYTDIAIGSAHLFGYKLTVNFRLPLLATNISDFWRRWHISLSNWLRDYLFIPLGGSRCSIWRMRLNLMIVMTLGGLWHGAAWTFVVWGMLHGFFLIIHKSWTNSGLLRFPALVSWLMTMMCVVFAFVIFRTSTWNHFTEFIAGFANVGGLQVNRFAWTMIVVIFAMEQYIAARMTNRRVAGSLPQRERSLGEAMAWGVVGSVALAVALFMAPGSSRSFIYFQF